MTIVIIVNGGAIQEVISDQEAKVIIVDRDTEGVEGEDLKTVLGEDAYVYHGITMTEVDTERIKQVIEEVSVND